MNIIAKSKNKTIKKQIQIAIISISIISTLILGFFVYAITTNHIEENYKENFSYNLKTADNMMNIQVQNIVELMRNLLMNDTYAQTLKNAAKDDRNYFSSSEVRIFESSVREMTLQADAIQEVLTFSMDGKMYIHSKKSDVSQYSKFYDKSIVTQDWVSKIIEQKGKEVIFGDNVLTGNKDTISIAKYMISPSTGEANGYIIVNVSKKILDKTFDNHGNYKTNSFMLIDAQSNNKLLYFKGDEELKETTYAQYLEGENIAADYIFCERNSSIKGWKLISSIQKNELNQQRKEIASMILGLWSILVVVGVVVSSSISNRIYRPLRKLELTIQQVEEGNRNITEEFDDSEVGQLGRKFKEMVNHNLVLRERLLYTKIKQREQELYLLQEQINPHFLYNTLDALYCLAQINEVEDIAKMVDALSETFRLSLNKGNNLITVKDEMKHITAYMTIQNMRFNNRFDFEVDIDEVIEIHILKLILEPFVENAICHGLEPKMGKGKVTLSGKRLGDGIVLFTITDNGVGVEDMRELEKGYGILNVKERIQLYYGEQFGVTFESTKDKGTTVYIKISEIGMESLAKDEAISSD